MKRCVLPVIKRSLDHQELSSEMLHNCSLFSEQRKHVACQLSVCKNFTCVCKSLETMVSLVYCMTDKPDFYVEGEAQRIENKYEIVFFSS